MPELPEVDAARRGFAEQFVGRRLVGVQLTLPKLIVAPAGLTLDHVIGQPLTSVQRYGKYLPLTFEDTAWIIHLKLSGQIVARGDAIPGFHAGHPVPHWGADLPHKSTHLILTFDNDAVVYITDIRHFARIVVLPAEDLCASLAALRLGPDAISTAFTRDWLHANLPRRSGSRLKPLLLDQSFIAGLGNIYVDECLFDARLHPERLAGSLSPNEIDALYDAIVRVMQIAVPIGGAEILNGKALPEQGRFPFVHGRQGAPCPRCGTLIIKERVNNRGTYRCPQCQPVPSSEETDR